MKPIRAAAARALCSSPRPPQRSRNANTPQDDCVDLAPGRRPALIQPPLRDATGFEQNERCRAESCAYARTDTFPFARASRRSQHAAIILSVGNLQRARMCLRRKLRHSWGGRDIRSSCTSRHASSTETYRSQEAKARVEFLLFSTLPNCLARIEQHCALSILQEG